MSDEPEEMCTDGKPHDYKFVKSEFSPVGQGRSHKVELYRCTKCSKDKRKVTTKQ